MTNNTSKAQRTVTNKHTERYTAPSEAHVQYVLEFTRSAYDLAREFLYGLLRNSDGTCTTPDQLVKMYSIRTLAIMACKFAADKIERGLADVAASVARNEAANK